MAKASTRKRAPSAAKVAPAPIPQPCFIAPVPDQTVVLAHPVEYAGRTYGSITKRRPSSAVLGRWFEQFTDGVAISGDPHLNVPIFVDEVGDLVPDAVLGFLDDDDRQTVFEDTERLFPKRLAVALEVLTQDSPPSSGEPAEPTSSA